ncbi:MAG: DUF2752 domain-containing protein [Pirellulales bacterium]
MTHATTKDTGQSAPAVRGGLAVLGLGLATLLAVAVWLEPNPRGRGTHQQLGLPPCSFVMLLDMPCPACGMTTSWAHFVRGQLPSALRANVGGTLLAAIATMFMVWSLVSAVRGRIWLKLPSDRVLVVLAATVITVTLIDWFVRLYNGGPTV